MRFDTRALWVGPCVALLSSLGLGFMGPAGAQEEKKPRRPVQEWQIKGVFAALDDPYPDVQHWALRKLAQLEPAGHLSPEQIQRITGLLEDRERADIHSPEQIQRITGLLEDR